MRELPILFSTEMVKAILDGRKSMTRRIVNPQPLSPLWDTFKPEISGKHWCSNINVRDENGVCYSNDCKYQPGDRLYVRETWADNIPGCPNGITYKADHIDPKGDGPANPIKWKPSLFMPKSAARIWLEVTGVRVERVQEMKLSDVYAEGIVSKPSPDKEALNPWKLFVNLWDDIAYKNDKTRFKTECGKYMWNADPWVWVIEFKRLEAEV